MECREFRDYFKRSTWSKEKIPSRYREHLGECRSCRIYYRALQLVEHPALLHTEGSPGLPERVMAGLSHKMTQSSSEALRWIRFATAAVLLVAVSVAGTLFVADRSREGYVLVHLHFSAPGAEQVAVVGDWNDWEPGSDLLQDKNGDGVWETRIKVPEGREYRYQFLIDGEQWVADPTASIRVDDGFGGTNSILDM